MAEKGNKGGFLGSFILGTLFGGALAVLATPYTGQQVREKIKDKVDDLKVSPPSLPEGIAKDPKEMIEKTISSIEDGISRIQSAIEEGTKAAEEKRRELSENKKDGE